MITYGKKIHDLSYRAGFNMISNSVSDKALNVTTDSTQKGQEIWAWVRKGDIGGFLRSESWDDGVTGNATETRTVFGADYYVSKGIVVSLVSDSTTNLKGTSGDKASKTGLFTQFKF